MMEMPFISIIVPVYNAENCLSRCVESLLGQSYTSFELILVDDGSSDNSLSICKRFAADKRVKIIHQENGGVSSARNKGLELAKGDYVAFVDADDWVNKDYLSSFVQDHADADLLVGGYECIEGKLHAVVAIEEKTYRDKDEIALFLERKLGNIVLQVPWGKLFKRDILVANEMRFDNQMFFGEDTLFVQEYLLFVRSIKSISPANYVYERQPKWQIKYGKRIDLQSRAFGQLLASLHDLSLAYNRPFTYAKDWLVNSYCQIYQSYLYQTPWSGIDKTLVRSFFHNRQVVESIRRFRKYRKNLLLVSLFRKNVALLTLYAKVYGWAKWR